MNDDKITELLSAYLDGESGDPEAVERLIGGDPAVRRRFEVLQAQSRALRALPPPEVSPAFAARVLAGARQSGFGHSAGGWRWRAVGGRGGGGARAGRRLPRHPDAAGTRRSAHGPGDPGMARGRS